VVKTPPPEDNILHGITRQVVLELARELGMETREESFTPEDLLAADECFLTGTGAEVIAVTSVDGKPIGTGKPGPVTDRLLTAFREYIATGDFS
jgi:branched-chain amino acid aminotransferase